MGIIYGVAMFTAEDVIIEGDPAKQEEISVDGQRALSRVPMDLGVAVKSKKLKDFEPILKRECDRQGIELRFLGTR